MNVESISKAPVYQCCHCERLAVYKVSACQSKKETKQFFCWEHAFLKRHKKI